MDLTIVEASRKISEQVSVPGSVATGRIIGRLAHVWQLAATDSQGRVLSYRLEDARTNRPIDPGATLIDAGVRENDVLRLVANREDSPTVVQAPPRMPSSAGPSAAGAATPALVDWADADQRTPPTARRALSAPLTLSLTAAGLVLLGVGVALAAGAFSGSTRRPPVVVTAPTETNSAAAPASSSGPSESERSTAQEAIMGLLASYQSAYSAHDTEGLERLFTQNVKRHGLDASGCRVSEGLAAVLASYRSQFEVGSGSYSLIGLSAEQIQIESQTAARLQAHYKITPGGGGYVNFEFAHEGSGWKISEVDASCQ